jgi:hypothetical protein
MTKSTLRNLIIAVGLFVIVVGGTLFAFLQVLRGSQTLEEQIIAVAAQNQQEETLLRMQRTAQTSEADRAELASYFLQQGSDSIVLINEIEERVGPALGLEIVTTELREVTEEEAEWAEVRFTVTGSREQTRALLRLLENLPYASRVKAVQMQGTRGAEWQSEITIQVQILSYAG